MHTPNRLYYLQAIVERHEAVVKRVKESHERIAARRHEMSLMLAKHQQLVDRINQLEAAVEEKNTEYKQVPYLLFNESLATCQ